MPRGNAAETRDRILRAAAAEILAEGYATASLSAIAGRLGLTKGALAYHFPSKADVATGLLDHMERAYNGLKAGVRADGLRGVRALIASIARMGMLSRTDIQFTSGLGIVLSPGTLQVTFPPMLLDMIDLFAMYLGEAVEDGDLPADTDVVEAAEDILAGAFGTFFLLRHHPERQGTRPLRFTRRQLAAIGVVDAGRIVDEMLQSGLAVPARFEGMFPDPS